MEQSTGTVGICWNYDHATGQQNQRFYLLNRVGGGGGGGESLHICSKNWYVFNNRFSRLKLPCEAWWSHTGWSLMLQKTRAHQRKWCSAPTSSLSALLSRYNPIGATAPPAISVTWRELLLHFHPTLLQHCFYTLRWPPPKILLPFHPRSFLWTIYICHS